MSAANNIESGLQRARQLHAAGQFTEAEQAYQRLLTPGPHREPVLAALANLYIETGRPNEALDTLTKLTELKPDEFYYLAWFATLLDRWGQTDAATDRYRAFLGRHPDNASAHFNLALLLKRNKEYAQALAEYERAIETGIDGAAEVWSNMGVACSEMRDAAKAREMFEKALNVDSDYIPALFNLAGLHEETGQRDKAIALYERIRKVDPAHFESLARIAYAGRIESADDPMIGTLEESTRQQQKDPVAHEALWFALGKSYDDCGRYEDAADAYAQANSLGRKRGPQYSPTATTRAIDDIMQRFDARWLESVETDSPQSPLFVCGMLRSGSTLTEQLLAGHPDIQPAGELDILPWLISRRLSPYPARAAQASRGELRELAGAYSDKVKAILGDDQRVTDKRPDNFLHLGLVRAMFPQAKIIHTVRNPLDTCLSIWFQQLGEYMAYATDIGSIAHYHLEHDRLMKHWQSLFGDNIFTLDYDALVKTPEPVMRKLLEFLELPWDDRCLAFQDADTMVKTASVWQVREGLYESSSGRWKNYAALVKDVRPLFEQHSDNR